MTTLEDSTSEVDGLKLVTFSSVVLGSVEATTDVSGVSVVTNSSVFGDIVEMESFVVCKTVVTISSVLVIRMDVVDAPAVVANSGVSVDTEDVVKSPVTGTDVPNSADEGLAVVTTP